MCLVSPVAQDKRSTDGLHVIGPGYQELLVCISQFTYRECLLCTVSVFNIICYIRKYNTMNKIFIGRHIIKHQTTLCNEMALHHPQI